MTRHLLACLALIAACAPPAPPARHLVLVVFDTLRADRMSVYGYERPTTPFLEEIAGQLVRYDGVKAPAPWTLPSHASLFTGLMPAEHGVHWGHRTLDAERLTLAEVLREAGFCTFALTANPMVSEKNDFDQGFERLRRIPKPAETQTRRLLDEVPALLAQARERDCRLFLFLNLMDAHGPFNAAAHGAAFGAPQGSPVTDTRAKWAVNAGARSLSPEESRAHAGAYHAAVRALDDAASELFGELERTGLLEESAVVLTSDHGEGLGEHGELGHVLSVWEEQLAVPLLVRFPGGGRGGTVVPGPRSLVALTPTLVDWLAVERPPQLREVPALEEEGEPIADYRSYFDPAFGGGGEMARRYPELSTRTVHAHIQYCPPHKLIVRADGSVEIYDLSSDPGERTSVAAGQPEALQRCSAAYRANTAAGLLTPFELEFAPETASEAERETLRSLGYLQ